MSHDTKTPKAPEPKPAPPKIRMALIGMEGKTEEEFVAAVLAEARKVGILPPKANENKNSKS